MPKGHAVIDGSNLATEGRKEPSLAQLDEAVRAIVAEYDFAQVTVIVDATFEHRVAKSETKAARDAVDDGDIITPPAGVIGRGDAFILQVADRAKAVVFSNDSFQEFHGTYDWLFDEGRLIGGKPIPAVGWIYVARSPVRGPISRRATAVSRKSAVKKAAPRKQAADTEEPRKREPRAKRATKETKETKETPAPATRSRRSKQTASGGEGSNNPARWKAFKADYPIGSTIAATVDRFSSHGAYGSVDDVVIYLPNRLLGSPAPTKARDVVDLGATMDFVIHRYDADRNGIDAGLIPSPDAATKSTRRPARKTVAKRPVAKKTAAKKAATKKTVAKKTAAKKAVAKKAVAKRAVAKGTAPTRAAKKAPVKRTAAKKVAKKSTPPKKVAKKAVAKPAAKKRAGAAKRTATTKAVKKAARRR